MARVVPGDARIPGFLRRRRLPEAEFVNGVPETWSLGYLTDVIDFVEMAPRRYFTLPANATPPLSPTPCHGSLRDLQQCGVPKSTGCRGAVLRERVSPTERCTDVCRVRTALHAPS